MAPEVVLQFALLTLSLAMFIALNKLPREALTKLRTTHRSAVQSSRHFDRGNQLLAEARSTTHPAQSLAHAKSALIEAEKAICISPKDPGPHVLKALALDLNGHRSSALRSLELALSPPRVKSLGERERGDALVKRAELKLATNRRWRVDSAVEDLAEAVKLLGNSRGTAFCLLGECYERKGLKEEAKKAFEEALRVEPGSVLARQGLERSGL